MLPTLRLPTPSLRRMRAVQRPCRSHALRRAPRRPPASRRMRTGTAAQGSRGRARTRPHPASAAASRHAVDRRLDPAEVGPKPGAPDDIGDIEDGPIGQDRPSLLHPGGSRQVASHARTLEIRSPHAQQWPAPPECRRRAAHNTGLDPSHRLWSRPRATVVGTGQPADGILERIDAQWLEQHTDMGVGRPALGDLLVFPPRANHDSRYAL